MAEPEAIDDLVACTREAFGALGVVAPNARIQVVAPFEELPPEKLDALIRINRLSAFHLARLTFADMKRRAGTD